MIYLWIVAVIYAIGFVSTFIRFTWEPDSFLTRNAQFKVAVFFALIWPWIIVLYLKEKFR